VGNTLLLLLSCHQALQPWPYNMTEKRNISVQIPTNLTSVSDCVYSPHLTLLEVYHCACSGSPPKLHHHPNTLGTYYLECHCEQQSLFFETWRGRHSTQTACASRVVNAVFVSPSGLTGTWRNPLAESIVEKYLDVPRVSSIYDVTGKVKLSPTVT
jgi:hypothetical protein